MMVVKMKIYTLKLECALSFVFLRELNVRDVCVERKKKSKSQTKLSLAMGKGNVIIRSTELIHQAPGYEERTGGLEVFTK